MDAGRLDRRVVIKRPVPIDDGYSQTTALEIHCERSAAYTPGRGREVFENLGVEARVPVTFTVRSDDETRQIDETFCVEYAERLYEITAITERARRAYLDLTAVAHDRQG
jgi:head-tail adaptor